MVTQAGTGKPIRYEPNRTASGVAAACRGCRVVASDLSRQTSRRLSRSEPRGRGAPLGRRGQSHAERCAGRGEARAVDGERRSTRRDEESERHPQRGCSNSLLGPLREKVVKLRRLWKSDCRHLGIRSRPDQSPARSDMDGRHRDDASANAVLSSRRRGWVLADEVEARPAREAATRCT